MCLGGLPISGSKSLLVVETNDGKTMDFTGRRVELVARGNKGYEAVKRKSKRFVRIVPSPIELADWDAIEAKDKKAEGPRTLFEEGGRS